MAAFDVLTLLATVAFFGTTIFTADANDVFIGESFEFTCGGGGRTGYWNFNGNPIGQSGPTSFYRGTATESLDGIFNCTNFERTVSYSNTRLKVYGLLGVSPSPSNCSSVDNNTNTCIVPATINSSLTLCVDFVKHPEHAKRHAELDQTIWQVLPGEENILSCYGSQCASPAVGYSYTGNWGRCLHVESVGNNALISYSIAEVFPPKDYPPNLVHRTVLFNVQVVPYFFSANYSTSESNGVLQLSAVSACTKPASIRLKSGTAIFGEDFSTLTGEEVITTVFDKESKVASVKVLIRGDLLDEERECFIAELQVEDDCIPPMQNYSTSICIVDTRTVLYTFQQPEYFVYESTGNVTLKLNSSRAIPSDYTVDVGAVFGLGNASAGFDFEGSHFTATFTANSTNATVDIPIIADFIPEGETESFTVQLSLPSHENQSHLPFTTHARFGNIPQATIYILEERVLNFPKGNAEVEEGENLILNITASTGSDEDFNFTVKITGHNQDSQCLNDIDCGPHPVTLEAGSMTASVNISTIDDEDPECDETFTAQIMFGGDGNSGTNGFRRGRTSDVVITVKDNEDVVVQEQFCFGDEFAAEFSSLKALPVNITRKRPTCNQASITLSLVFEGDNNGSTFNESCTFQPLQLNKVCSISLRGKNEGFVNDTFPGVVSIVQENTSFCNQTEKEVIIYKLPTYCWQTTNATRVSVGVDDGSEPFVVSINRSVSRYPSYLPQQCARFRIKVNGGFGDETYSLRPDHCCFSSETNSPTASCNVSVSGLNTSMGRQMLSLQLEHTDVNLVCNESVLSLTVNISDDPNNMTPAVSAPSQPSDGTFIGVSVALAVLMVSVVGACVPVIVCTYFISRHSRKETTERIRPSVEYRYIGGANAEVVRLLDATEEEWEISRSEVELGDKLGQGNYGAVFKGQLRVTAMTPKIHTHKKEMDFEGKSHLSVAVKMLRYNSSAEEEQLFTDEINVMKRVSDGNNPHVLKMLGCVTATNPMMLVLQFVPQGNLKNYLRAMKTADDVRDVIHGSSRSTGGKPTSTGGDPTSTGGDSDLADGEVQSCSTLLLSGVSDVAPLLMKFASFGYQITSGMEFLMSKGVIHRDLACRNILVGDNELLKICDFGLAKETLEYTSALKTRLPIRWMAPEALLRGEFSEKSDVWAYGVCLWEIFSFGDLPYTELAHTVIVSRVVAGYRLESPKTCSDQIYSIMQKCWNDDKESRPTFLELKDEFDGLISQEERYNYLPLMSETTEARESAPQPTECSDPSPAEESAVSQLLPAESSAPDQNTESPC